MNIRKLKGKNMTRTILFDILATLRRLHHRISKELLSEFYNELMDYVLKNDDYVEFSTSIFNISANIGDVNISDDEIMEIYNNLINRLHKKES